MSLAARDYPLAASSRTEATTANGQVRLDKKSDCFENLVAQFNITELGCLGELQFFPEPIKDGRVKVRALVQQVEQFCGSGCVLIVGLDAA